MSQMDLALDVSVSPRHLSFVETGRSRPSRGLVLRMAEKLKMPPRARNALLVSVGYAPAFPERPIDDPALGPALAAIERLLASFHPFPALAIDRHWNLLRNNAALGPLIEGVAPWLMAAPVNVLRLGLHPEGLAPRIFNLGEWKAHICHRLEMQIDATGDIALTPLLAELRGYPAGHVPERRPDAIAVPLVIDVGGRRMSFLSMTMVFGTPIDVTLAEVAIETLVPADAETSALLLQGG
ncbi:transcriptional regulator [Sphingomonas sp. DBB INV C78]